MYSLITYKTRDFQKDTRIPENKLLWKSFELVPESGHYTMNSILLAFPTNLWQWGVPLRMWGPIAPGRERYFDATREVLLFDVHKDNYPIRLRKPFIWGDVLVYLKKIKRRVIG